MQTAVAYSGAPAPRSGLVVVRAPCFCGSVGWVRSGGTGAARMSAGRKALSTRRGAGAGPALVPGAGTEQLLALRVAGPRRRGCLGLCLGSPCSARPPKAASGSWQCWHLCVLRMPLKVSWKPENRLLKLTLSWSHFKLCFSYYFPSKYRKKTNCHLFKIKGVPGHILPLCGQWLLVVKAQE